MEIGAIGEDLSTPPADCARLPYAAAAAFAGEEVADRALPDVSAARPASGALSPLALLKGSQTPPH